MPVSVKFPPNWQKTCFRKTFRNINDCKWISAVVAVCYLPEWETGSHSSLHNASAQGLIISLGRNKQKYWWINLQGWGGGLIPGWLNICNIVRMCTRPFYDAFVCVLVSGVNSTENYYPVFLSVRSGLRKRMCHAAPIYPTVSKKNCLDRTQFGNCFFILTHISLFPCLRIANSAPVITQ